ncbi:sodium/proton antiporter (CPA1 family) [Anseongella ginsenosidimutans]|uniref:Sodium/proton antiporter (CPA1 family) n=1 Tax=Anseongella ginsenosidimutans TaxID=496056 RepID=A0A4R3KPI7_9SPHI|nr:cation:proton antiporter [Anseongella ginsenosidimutans]QEC53658.1 hypothetical protein FRZ59_15830 [Anseongella ginsenosidimutans]TCS86092.1 sodium/proton antiporter (CPA1 family) [Anseongella ginsenosidimutans]
MQTAIVIVTLGLIVFLSHYFKGIFSRYTIPDVLWLFLMGICLGPWWGIVEPEDFGKIGPVFTTIVLVFILFESGTDLQFDCLKKSLKGIAGITLLNFLGTVAILTPLAYYFIGLPLLQSVMLGAILGGTSSAVVTTLIRQFKVRQETSAILVMESALSDVLTLAIPIALMQAYQTNALNVGSITGKIIASFLFAIMAGCLGAFLWSILLHYIRNLQNSIFTTPAFVFVVFGIVEILGFSGAIAALAFGITLGNVKYLRPPIIKQYIEQEPIELNQTEKNFFSEIVFLLRTFFFIYIGLSIQLDDMNLVLYGLGFTLLLFLVRIPVVRLSVNTRKTPLLDISLMSTIIPKGLGCAVLATLPYQEGIPGGRTIMTLTFSIILFSTILTTIFVFLVTKTKMIAVYRLLLSWKKYHVSAHEEHEPMKKLHPREEISS